MAPLKTSLMLLLSTSSLYSMEQYKEQLHRYLQAAKTCNPHIIRTNVPAEALKSNSSAFLDTALSCPNTNTILPVYDEIVTEGGPSWKSKFSHYYNIHARRRENGNRNYFLEKLIEHRKY